MVWQKFSYPVIWAFSELTSDVDGDPEYEQRFGWKEEFGEYKSMTMQACGREDKASIYGGTRELPVEELSSELHVLFQPCVCIFSIKLPRMYNVEALKIILLLVLWDL